jgi:hypothetical protein
MSPVPVIRMEAEMNAVWVLSKNVTIPDRLKTMIAMSNPTERIADVQISGRERRSVLNRNKMVIQ